MNYATMADRNSVERESPWEDRDIPVTTFALLSGTADLHGQRPATTFQMFSGVADRAETLTWSELRDRTAQAANMFRCLGIGENDVVAYVLPNCTETILTFLGGQISGIVNPINPLLAADQIAALLRETGAKVVVTLRTFPKTDVAQKVAEAVSRAPDVETVVEVDLLRYVTGVKKLLVPLLRPKLSIARNVKILNFQDEIQKHPVALEFADSKSDRVCALFHTGGTTGTPKLVRHRYSGVIYNAWLGSRLLLTEKDVQICPLPMFHVFAAVVTLGASLSSGAHTVFPTPQGYRGEGVFDNFWKLVERHRATFMMTVPTAVAALMQRSVDADISSLKLAFCGSAPLPVELYRRFETAAGVTICEGYGLTEATCLVSCNPPDGEKKVGSIGFPFPYTDVKVVRETGEGPIECEMDQVGEICVSGPGVTADGIYTDPEKNRDLYHFGGYLRTGDLGRVDSGGYLWITGRAKDLIIRGGHNIDPAVIEEALAGHEAVAFTGAIGQPDAHAGELPCVYVELVDGAQVSERELMEHVQKSVSERAAIPKHLEILDELPKTAVGKVFKPDLRRLAITRTYDEALREAGLSAKVIEVVEDRKLGLVAKLSRTGEVEDEAVDGCLGAFTRPWRWE